jgi:hypothetical protein
MHSRPKHLMDINGQIYCSGAWHPRKTVQCIGLRAYLEVVARIKILLTPRIQHQPQPVMLGIKAGPSHVLYTLLCF